MCSVSFVPRDDGFVLAMNRDELFSRAAALPPEVRSLGKLAALCPREPAGGTWVGVNTAGMAFSLINWHLRPERVRDDLSELKQKRVVRAVGVSCHDFGALKTAATHPWVDVILPASTTKAAGSTSWTARSKRYRRY